MKIIDRVPPAAWTAGLGASVLLISLALWRTNDVLAQNDPGPAPAAVVQPSEDPGLEPAVVENGLVSGSPEKTIRKWPQASRAAARAMLAKYGRPQSYTGDELIWLDNGSWDKTVVYRGSADCVEQTVRYQVPAEKVNDLKRFDRRLSVSEPGGLLSSRAGSERMNILALNLADEIVTGKRTVEDARGFYAKTVKLSEAGKSSSYTKKLMFPARAKAR